MYNSPITEVLSDMTETIRIEHENGIIRAVQKVGFDVNKAELEKALAYDRGQYEKGYADAMASRPQGEWIDKAISIIDDMQREGIIEYEQAWEFRMRARMKGAENEHDK